MQSTVLSVSTSGGEVAASSTKWVIMGCPALISLATLLFHVHATSAMSSLLSCCIASAFNSLLMACRHHQISEIITCLCAGAAAHM